LGLTVGVSTASASAPSLAAVGGLLAAPISNASSVAAPAHTQIAALAADAAASSAVSANTGPGFVSCAPLGVAALASSGSAIGQPAAIVCADLSAGAIVDRVTVRPAMDMRAEVSSVRVIARVECLCSEVVT
jgi:hypothetical protein